MCRVAPKASPHARNSQQQPAQGTGIVNPDVTQVHFESGDLWGLGGDGGGDVVPPGSLTPGPPSLGEKLWSHFRQQLWPKAFWDSPGMRASHMLTTSQPRASQGPGDHWDLVTAVVARLGLGVQPISLALTPPPRTPSCRAEREARRGYRARLPAIKGLRHEFLSN